MGCASTYTMPRPFSKRGNRSCYSTSSGSSLTRPRPRRSEASKSSQSGRAVEGPQFQGFYGYGDGTGGFAIIEADSATALAKASAPFTPWLRFTARPILPVEEATAIAVEAIAFRDSVQ